MEYDQDLINEIFDYLVRRAEKDEELARLVSESLKESFVT